MAWYYGSDLDNATPFPTCTSAAPNFYIGRIEGELTAAGKGASGFDVTAAQDVGGPSTFAVWDLAGPGSLDNVNGLSPMQWGTAQAQAFLNAWQTGYFQTNVGIGGRTFFLGVESANGGWTGGSAYYTANQQVLIGALTYLNGISNLIGEAASAGLYIIPESVMELMVKEPKHALRVPFGFSRFAPNGCEPDGCAE